MRLSMFLLNFSWQPLNFQIYTDCTLICLIIAANNNMEDLRITGRVETIQTTALLRSARILSRVLETCHSNSELQTDINSPNIQFSVLSIGTIEYIDCTSEEYSVYCYLNNVSADMYFGLLQVFHVKLGSSHRISNWNLFWSTGVDCSNSVNYAIINYYSK